MDWIEDDAVSSRKSQYIPTTLSLSEGNKYLRLLKFEKAITFFDKVLRKEPHNTHALLGRAKSNMRLAKYKEAWRDFDTVVNLNPKCTEALYFKGMTEYLKGDFETAFITYSEGHKLKPFCNDLDVEHRVCKEAIANSLDRPVRILLTERDVTKMNNLNTNQNARATGYNKKGLYATDLKLLEDILNDKSKCYLHSLCKDLFDYLLERQKFWAMQAPRASAQRSSGASYLKNDVSNAFKINRLVRNFGLCKIALREGKTAICIKKGSEVLDLLSDVTSSDFPEKTEMEAETLHCLVMAHLAEERFTTAMKYCKQQLDTVNKEDFKGSKGRVFKDFGEMYCKVGKYDEALKFFLSSLEFAKDEEEKGILLYKISDCHVHLNNLKDATSAAQNCFDLAVRSQDSRFQFDVLLLRAEIDLKGRNMKLAEENYRDALAIAIQTDDSRQYELERLLKMFEKVAAKSSYSRERTEMEKIIDLMKNT